MIRFGLLGCGRIAKRHSELLGGGHIDRARLVAVCDPIRPRVDAIASKFGVPAHYDIDDFLARKDIDAVAVLTPSGMHPAHVIACARAGKHVVVEKPMALRLQDADDMVHACDQAEGGMPTCSPAQRSRYSGRKGRLCAAAWFENAAGR